MDDKLRLTPAALDAALSGDVGNALIAATPGGIEAQEKQGQVELVSSTMLPKDGPWKQLEQLGFERLYEIDDLFVRAKFPEGWTRQATEHSMHSIVLDAQGRKRITIFYKAAFYDRSAHTSLIHRFSAGTTPVCGYDSPEYDYDTSPIWGMVTDCGAVIWHTEAKITRPGRNAEREECLIFYDRQDALATEARAWLDEHYPNWHDPLAYWTNRKEVPGPAPITFA